MVAATAEFESAVTVALQQTQTSTTIVRNTGSTVTPLDLTEHTPTLVPTDPPNVTKTKEPTGTAGPNATVTPSATTASTNTRDAIDTLTAIAAIQVPESDLREIAMRLHGYADIPATVSSQPASHQHGDVIEFSATN
ncbi:MAG: hypothetical protein QF660_03410, partial [Anaerolineales bacterium]|nr:hypothetical protein [Anaerolineales bacterium]